MDVTTANRKDRTVILLVSGASAEVRRHPDLGVLVVPKAGNSPAALPAGRPFALDNGAFSGLDVPLFVRMIRRYEPIRDRKETGRCLFVTAPDSVGDAATTARQFEEWEPWLHARGWPVAFVGQDGLRLADVPWRSIEAVFLGGTTAWKLGRTARDLAAYGRARGKWVHMGRVNSARRIRYALRIGVESVDGLQWSAWSSLYLPRFAPIVTAYHGGPLFAPARLRGQAERRGAEAAGGEAG